MFAEEELLPLAALQHIVFCERQCALIYLEQQWADNALTLEGEYLHRRVHEEAPRREVRGDLVILRGLVIHSLKLGIVGKPDVVEFHRAPPANASLKSPEGTPLAVALPGLKGAWTPFPVEYKRGKPKYDLSDAVQLCAQALCLEEMLGVHVEEGALFYGSLQRRHAIAFTKQLRDVTCHAAERLHRLFSLGRTPRAEKEPKCEQCSLLPLCMPEALSRRRSARRYVQAALHQSLERSGEEP